MKYNSFAQALRVAEEIYVKLLLPRVAVRQQHDNNRPWKSPEEY